MWVGLSRLQCHKRSNVAVVSEACSVQHFPPTTWPNLPRNAFKVWTSKPIHCCWVANVVNGQWGMAIWTGVECMNADVHAIDTI
jgi:hypothetical protein